MKTIVRANNFEFSFTDEDVIDKDSVDCFEGSYNPHSTRLWLLHDAGYTLCVVQADCLQDAIDNAVDAGKLERYLVSESEMGDYDNEVGLAFLGNAGEPHDIESLGYVELPPPKQSLTRLYGESVNAASFHV